MITEDYVSFETAKLLKKKGFNIACEYQYINCSSGCPFLTDIRDDVGCYYKNTEIGQDEYSAPTLQMVVKWLREVHNIHIDINTNWAFKDDFIVVGYMFNTHSIINSWYQDLVNYSTYEGACEAALKYSLENLI